MNRIAKAGIGVGIAVAIVGVWLGYSYDTQVLSKDREFEKAQQMSCPDLKTYIDYYGYHYSGAVTLQTRIFDWYETKCGKYIPPGYQGGPLVSPTTVGP